LEIDTEKNQKLSLMPRYLLFPAPYRGLNDEVKELNTTAHSLLSSPAEAERTAAASGAFIATESYIDGTW